MHFISPLAFVEETAELADDVRVGPFSCIGPQVRIGPGCVIDNNVTVVGRTTLGAGIHLFPMSVVGTPAEESDTPGEVVIAEGNAIREHVTIYAGTDRPTIIGKDNLIMIGSQVGAGARIDSHGIFANCTQIGPDAHIEDYVRTSGFAMIARGVTIGAYTFIAGYADVDRDMPPFAMIQGSPVRVRGVNTHNLKCCGFGEDDIRTLKSAFRELFNNCGKCPDESALGGLAALAEENPHVRRVVQALGRSKGWRDE